MSTVVDEVFQALLDELKDELVDYPVAVWEVAACVRGRVRDADERAVEVVSVRLCQSLLSSSDTVLVWMCGHYDRPGPDGGPSPISMVPPAEVEHDMFTGPTDLSSSEPYLAILKVM